MGYTLSRAAEQDIIALYVDGVKKFGNAQAEKYFAKLEDAFALLAEFPGLAYEREEFTPPVRIHPCGEHVIIYRVDEAENIFIIRVRHGREDWIKHPV